VGVEFGLSDLDGLVEIIVGQIAIENVLPVVFQVGRLPCSSPTYSHSVAHDSEASCKGTEMSRKCKKKRQPDAAVRDDELKMSDVIVKLAEPLLKRYGNSPQRFESIIALTIAVWNNALLPADTQRMVEQKLIDGIIPKDGRAEDVGAFVQAMDIIKEQRKSLFPNLRRLIASYDIKFSDGRISLDIGWEPVPVDG
jgi:hypothetical protein